MFPVKIPPFPSFTQYITFTWLVNFCTLFSESSRYEIEELSYVRSVDNEDLGSDNLKLAIESGMTEDRKNGKVTLKAKFPEN